MLDWQAVGTEKREKRVGKWRSSLSVSPTGSLGVEGSEGERRRRENLDQSRESTRSSGARTGTEQDIRD
jgi:hypothetical protein